ncbi:hypothetical protein CAPTEDRAFT_188064 [Capitella teleta]|uniref:Uncharacterized protein n=1 Tax=Capitella teleta TaxID=283909 RepID=R7UNC3_CAPTE|nr:hypothetical protein CAPTEDRAFT_188064 [Capitella teleta]|eukprot:ELU07558.1 hypothetical protein CAPTEDRAFT_188064 [Capitella teleta]
MDSPIVIAGILDYEIMLYIKGCGDDYSSFCLIEKNVSQKHHLIKVGDALRDLVAIGCLDIITKKPQVKGCINADKFDYKLMYHRYNIILDDVFVNGQKVLSANDLEIDPLGTLGEVSVESQGLGLLLRPSSVVAYKPENGSGYTIIEYNPSLHSKKKKEKRMSQQSLQNILLISDDYIHMMNYSGEPRVPRFSFCRDLKKSGINAHQVSLNTLISIDTWGDMVLEKVVQPPPKDRTKERAMAYLLTPLDMLTFMLTHSLASRYTLIKRLLGVHFLHQQNGSLKALDALCKDYSKKFVKNTQFVASDISNNSNSKAMKRENLEYGFEDVVIPDSSNIVNKGIPWAPLIRHLRQKKMCKGLVVKMGGKKRKVKILFKNASLNGLNKDDFDAPCWDWVQKTFCELYKSHATVMEENQTTTATPVVLEEGEIAPKPKATKADSKKKKKPRKPCKTCHVEQKKVVVVKADNKNIDMVTGEVYVAPVLKKTKSRKRKQTPDTEPKKYKKASAEEVVVSKSDNSGVDEPDGGFP